MKTKTEKTEDVKFYSVMRAKNVFSKLYCLVISNHASLLLSVRKDLFHIEKKAYLAVSR